MDENTNLTPENNSLDNTQNPDNKNKQDLIKLIAINIGVLVIVALMGILLLHISNSNKSQEYIGSEVGDVLQDQENTTSVDDIQNDTNTNTTVISTYTGTGIDTAPS